jgi:hypothetical protein
MFCSFSYSRHLFHSQTYIRQLHCICYHMRYTKKHAKFYYLTQTIASLEPLWYILLFPLEQWSLHHHL